MKSRSANTRGDVFDCVNRIAEYMRRSGAGESQLGELTESLAKALQSHVEAGGKINEGVFGAWEYLNMGQIALCCAKIDPNDGGGTWLGEVEELFRVALYELEAELELAYEYYPNDLDTAEHSKELKEKLGDIKETAELLHASLKGKETRSIAFIAAERTSENEVLAVLTGKPGELDNLTAALAYTRADASFKVLDVVANLYSSGMPPGILRLGAGYGTKDHAQHVLETGTPQNFFEMLADGDHDWKALLGKEELAAGIKSAAENLEWVEYFVPKEPISRLISEETAKAMIADASPEVYEWLFAAAAERRWLTVPASFNPNMDGRRWAEELWGEVSLEDVPKMSVRSLLEIRANRLRGSAGAAAKETAVRMLAESTGGDLVAVLALNGAADTFPGSVEDLRNFVVEAARQPVKNVEPTAPLEAETKTPKRRTGARKTSPVERGRAAGPA